MTLRKPNSMEECVYYTDRVFDKGEMTAWVFREKCPKCGKALMGKPKDPKTGKVKTRATEYICPECEHIIPKQEYEDTLTVNIAYVCPECGNKSETQEPFKWKKIRIEDPETGKKKAVEVIKFQCDKCKKELHLVRKMKA